MKTLQSTNKKEISRVNEKVALELIETGNWNYIPKKVWKEEVRDKLLNASKKINKEKKEIK